MSIEIEILEKLSKWYAHPHDPEAWEIDLMSEAVDFIMPLVKRAQAEALREAVSEGPKKYYPLDGYGHSASAIPVEWLNKRADKIEKEAGA